MTNVRDVPAQKFIDFVAKDLVENQKVIIPDFAKYVKTGISRERAPQRDDWWQVRMASIFRKVYVSGKVTVKALRSYYGGKKNRGVKPEKFYKASGKIIRVCLQDLQKLGFVKIADDGGRVLTSKGQGYLDALATKLAKEMVKEKPKEVKQKAKEDKKVKPAKEEKKEELVKEDKKEELVKEDKKEEPVKEDKKEEKPLKEDKE